MFPFFRPPLFYLCYNTQLIVRQQEITHFLCFFCDFSQSFGLSKFHDKRAPAEYRKGTPDCQRPLSMNYSTFAEC